MDHSIFVGLDVHKKSTSVALVEAERSGEVRFHGEVPSTPEAMRRLVEKLELLADGFTSATRRALAVMACIGCYEGWNRIVSWLRRR